MGKDSPEVSDKVTVLVFKDNYSARTFQVPLNWITRSGILLGILASIAFISPIVALRYYRLLEKTDPVRVQELEQELSELKSSVKHSHIKESPIVSAPVVAPQPSPSLVVQSQPETPVENTSPTFLFFPKSVTQAQTLNSPDLPFTIQNPQAYWRGHTLKLRFALQYTKDDQGNQQGRILIFAKGPDRLIVFPTNAIGSSDSESFIDPSKGEAFSVSRYREAKADFLVHDRSSIKEIEILIFNKDNQLLSYKKHMITSILTKAPAVQETEANTQTDKTE